MDSTPAYLAPRHQQRLLRDFGPWALVTGASDGIGMAMAEQLAAAGLDVVVTGRREARLQELATYLASTHGVETRAVAVDLAGRDGVDRLWEAVADLDLGLVAASAGFGSSGPFVATDRVVELEMLDVNCRAVLDLTHRVAERFADRGRGGIVLLSSVVAFQGVPLSANYAATKALSSRWPRRCTSSCGHMACPFSPALPARWPRGSPRWRGCAWVLRCGPTRSLEGRWQHWDAAGPSDLGCGHGCSGLGCRRCRDLCVCGRCKRPCEGWGPATNSNQYGLEVSGSDQRRMLRIESTRVCGEAMG